MNQPNQRTAQIFQIQPINYPNTLLLGTNAYTLHFSATNLASTAEKYHLGFKGEGLEVKVAKQFTKPVMFDPNQSIQIDAEVTPTKTGQAKIIIEAVHQRQIQYTELVWHVRDQIPEQKTDQILSKSYLEKPSFEVPEFKQLSSFYSGGAIEISAQDAKEEVEFLLHPPPEPEQDTGLDGDGVGDGVSGGDGAGGEDSQPDPPVESAMDILNELKSKKPASSSASKKISRPRNVGDLSETDINERLAEIARGVFNSDKSYGLEILEEISDSALREELIIEFFIPLAVENIGSALKILPEISDKEIKTKLIRDLIQHYFILGELKVVEKLMNLPDVEGYKNELFAAFARHNVETDYQASREFIEMIDDTRIKQQMFKILAASRLDDKSDEVLSLLENITDQNFQYGLLFELCKKFAAIDKSKATTLASRIAEMAKSEKNLQNLADALTLIAHLQKPQTAVDYINSLDDTIKSTINETLRDELWVQVEETKSRVEEVPVLSVYYSFNTAVNPTRPIEMVHNLGGNISENLLSGDFSTFIGVICPFGFDFPIFPPIQQSYAQIKTEKGKSFYYMIIPTKIETEQEFLFIQTLLNTWFVSNEDEFRTKVYIFNLDFIPYLAKPTIIMGSDKEENVMVKSVVHNTFNEDVSFIVDDGLFKGGMVNQLIQQILPKDKFKVLNLVMTYDFLNNYDLFKRFMDAFIK